MKSGLLMSFTCSTLEKPTGAIVVGDANLGLGD